MSSWADLMDQMYQDAWDPRIERFRSPFVFRGMGRASNDLSTSLLRLADGREDITRLEGHLLRNFKQYAHADAAEGHSVWNWLALAAHHGLPTRLLDWSYSPTVALHFATENLSWYGEDAVVWCVNHRELATRLPDQLQQVLEIEGSDVFTVEMLNCAAATLEKLQHLSEEPFVLFLEPPSLDARIVNQFALFSMMSTADASLDEWLTRNPGIVRKIIIPAELKWEVRDKLDQTGITERMLFPGLDGLTAWLTRYYALRRGKHQELVDRNRTEAGGTDRR
ncbi:MAG TPA: FRG domain-containing protein [Bryobacteraceae bacterium]|nr:FRG domain-containing protein [Bryobacteraceae bacterium]